MIIKCINMFSCHFTSMKSELKPCGPQLKLIPVGMKLGMKRPAVSLLSPEWDESPSQGPHSSSPYPPEFHQASPTIYLCPFILLSGERHCESTVLWQRTQHIDPARSWTLTSPPRVQHTIHHKSGAKRDLWVDMLWCLQV